MKKAIFGVLCVLVLACEKRVTVSQQPASLTTQAQKYFSDSVAGRSLAVSYRAAQPRSILWAAAQITKVNNGWAVIVPIVYNQPMMVKANIAGDFYFHLNYLTQLLMYRDSNSVFQTRVLTSFPDSNYFKNPAGAFSGIQFVEDWQGNELAKYLYSPNGNISTFKSSTMQPNSIYETCFVISGYNYSPDDPEGGYYWSEDGGCSYQYVRDDGGGGGAGGGAPGGGAGGHGPLAVPLKETVAIAPGRSIIQSVPQYFQCFTNVGGSDHSFTVTVCVDQPTPGARTSWLFTTGGITGTIDAGNPVNVGHTFLTLTETYAGTTISRNIGFYPSTIVYPPSNLAAPGQFNDDETHTYNISGSFSLNNAQFFQILNFISSANNSSFIYNLNSNNCTTFVLNALAQAGINLPRTFGTWPGGTGDDPGDLGEDIRTGNIAGMTVNTAPANNHQNVGQCN